VEKEEKDARQTGTHACEAAGASWRVRVSRPQNVAFSSQDGSDFHARVLLQHTEI
jgi:hypothetical protein